MISGAPMRTDPYADAPTLPPGDGAVDPRALLGAGLEPVEVEIGPGRGGFMLERLEAVPGARILGLEIRRKWAAIVDRRLAARGFGDRGRVLAEDARWALRRFPAECVRAVYVHFPDPWWKKRHFKRLVVSPELLEEVVRVLVPGGELFIQTDVEDRARAYAEIVGREPRLEPWAASAEVPDNPYSARSPRERRAMADGLPVTRLRYRRR